MSIRTFAELLEAAKSKGPKRVAVAAGGQVEIMLAGLDAEVAGLAEVILVGDDNMIQTYIISTLFSLPEDLVPNLSLSAGAAYLSNIADTDTLQEDIASLNITSIAEHIDAVSSFISSRLDFLLLTSNRGKIK